MKSLVVFLLFGGLTACNIYKSEGRKSFERDSAGRTNLSFKAESQCWSQLQTEPLWSTQASRYIVSKTDEKHMEVCTNE